MRLIIRSIAAATLAGVLASIAMAPPASADITTPVDCSKHPHVPGCTIHVGTPGQPGDSPGGSGGDGNSGSGSGSGDDEWDGCHYEAAPNPPAPPAGKTPKDGGWYVKSCIVGDNKGGPEVSAPMWIDGPAPAVDPAVLARQAVSRLSLPVPGIRVNPAPPAAQLVFLPTWLWLDRSSWRSRSATASVPGLSITATAKPARLVFTTGDGSTVTCHGAGTVWTSARNPSTASPDCGHTYTRPGSTTLTATVTWQVGWAGGGQTGTVPDLTTTSAITLLVIDSQALNTNPQG